MFGQRYYSAKCGPNGICISSLMGAIFVGSCRFWFEYFFFVGVGGDIRMGDRPTTKYPFPLPRRLSPTTTSQPTKWLSGRMPTHHPPPPSLPLGAGSLEVGILGSTIPKKRVGTIKNLQSRDRLLWAGEYMKITITDFHYFQFRSGTARTKSSTC